jgi:hypothetical protein
MGAPSRRVKPITAVRDEVSLLPVWLWTRAGIKRGCLL